MINFDRIYNQTQHGTGYISCMNRHDLGLTAVNSAEFWPTTGQSLNMCIAHTAGRDHADCVKDFSSIMYVYQVEEQCTFFGLLWFEGAVQKFGIECVCSNGQC